MAGKIEVTLTRTPHEKPLAVIQESPLSALGVEHTPEQLRRLAAALMMIAEDAEAHCLDLPDVQRVYPL